MRSATSSSSVAVASSNGTPTIKGRRLVLSFLMLRTLTWIVLLTIPACHADNSPNPYPYHITLSDGSNSSDIYLVGTFDDHRLADENDYTLVECDSSGDMLCYAQMDPATGDLISTGTTIENPPPVGLQPGEDASLERKEELCAQLCLDKQTEPISNCIFLTESDNTLTNPLVDECPDIFPAIFDSNVHMNIGSGTEHAHLGLIQYFNGNEDDRRRRRDLSQQPFSRSRHLEADCSDAEADGDGNEGLILQYTDLNGVNQCEEYSLACGGAITDRMVKCEPDGYGTLRIHYHTDPATLAGTLCSSNPRPADTCSYTLRVRCASDCAIDDDDRRRLESTDKKDTWSGNLKKESAMATDNAIDRSLQTATVEPTTIRNLVVLFRFADHATRTLPTFVEYDALMNDPDYSVRDVFIQSSNGNLLLDSDVLDWITLDPTYTEAHCAGGRSGGVPVFHECLKNALDKIAPLVDFLLYDSDADDMIDSITFFHSGFAAEWGRPDEYGAAYQDRIWSHKWGMFPYWTSNEAVCVGKYHVNPGVWGVSGSTIGRIGVVAHETAHALGLGDRYDTSGVGNGLGSYSLMANSWGFDGSQRYPPKLSPCDTMELGWANIIELTALGTYQLESQCDSDAVYKLGDGRFGLPVGEFFLFENRQNCGYDILVEPGLAIYHYDSKALDVMTDDRTDPQYGKPQGFPGAEGFPGDGKHYKCALVQADGLYELEKGANRGNSGDLFRPGQVLGPSNDPLLGPFPNTDAYQCGYLNQTGIIIRVGDFFFDSNAGYTGSTTNADSTGLIRGRRLQQTTPAISFTVDATGGSPATKEGAALTPTGLPTISDHPSSLQTHAHSSDPSTVPSSSPNLTSSDWPSSRPSLTDSARPSTYPSGAPVLSDSARPSTYPVGAPVLSDSARPSTYPSGAPVILAASVPSNMPSAAATVTARAGDTTTTVPSGQPSLMPSLLPDPPDTSSSLCKESQMVAVDPFIMRTVLLNIASGEFDVAIEYKGEGDQMWNPFCHATNVVGQYPEYTLLPESACTALTVLVGEEVKLRLTAQPTSPSIGGGNVIRGRSLLGEQDIMQGRQRLDSMYNFEENECTSSSTL